LAAIGGLLVDLPAAALGAKLNSSQLPGGVEIADTVIQDIAFVAAAVLCGHLGGRAVSAWRLGLRPTGVRRAAGLIFLTLGAFFLFTVIWANALDVSVKEKLLEQLGANESTELLAASAALTTVVAPISEEILFRGFIFRALANWKGPWPAAILTGLVFGAVHTGSAPAVDLVPLAVLGFGLCLLYWFTGSLYPCIVLHSLNNSIAFGELEGWSVGQTVGLAVGALLVIWALAQLLRRTGVITPERPGPRGPQLAGAGPGAGVAGPEPAGAGPGTACAGPGTAGAGETGQTRSTSTTRA
jgi:membrane protease YdiL (CAAX protease family)